MRGKPGPKPKVKAAIGVACPEGYIADGDYYKPEAPAMSKGAMEIAAAKEMFLNILTPSVDSAKAQSLALRIWSGQSPDVPVIERVSRIVNGLREQGFELDITLPHPDAERYLNAHK